MIRQRTASLVLLCAAALLAVLVGTLGPTRQAYAKQGSLTIEPGFNEGATYDGYHVFAGEVDEEGVATHLSWPDEQMRTVLLGLLDEQGYTSWLEQTHPGDDQHDIAQNAAEYTSMRIRESQGEKPSGNEAESVEGTSFAATLARHLAASGIEPMGSAVAGEPFSGEQGYWLFVSNAASIDADGETGTSALWLALGDGPTEATEKTAQPTLRLEVQEDSTHSWGSTADANRGQSVPVQLTATLPSNFDAFEHYHCRFEVTLPEGIDLTIPHGADLSDLIDVYLGDAQVKPDGEDLTVGLEGKSLYIDIRDLRAERWSDVGIDASTPIVAEFAVHLSEDAAIGMPGNAIEARLVYTADPVSGIDNSSEPQVAHVFAWGLDVLKTDDETDESLAGAGFTMRAASDSNGSDLALYVQEDGSLGGQEYEHKTGADGHLQVSGLDEGTYLIRETTAPAGYDKLADDVELKVERTLSDTDGKPNTLTASTSSKGAKVTGVESEKGRAKVKVSDPKTKQTASTTASDSSSSEGGATKVERLPQTGVGPIAETLIVMGVALLGATLLRQTTGRRRRGMYLLPMAALACALALTLRPALAEQGSVTIAQRHNTGASYDAYQLFAADIADDDTATHVAWPSADTKRVMLAFLDGHGYASWLADAHDEEGQHDLAQNAAEYTALMIADSKSDTAAATTPRTTAAQSFATELAQALAADGSLSPQTASAGTSFTANEGYWLFVTNASSDENSAEAATAPIFLPLGGSTTSIDEKSALPTVDKEVREGSTGAWGKVADAQVGQEVDYRLTATLPANFDAFESYQLCFEDQLTDGLDLSVPDGASLADAITVRIAGTPHALSDGLTAAYANHQLRVAFDDLKAPAWDACGLEAGSEITVEYRARMNAQAVVGSAGNANTVSLTFTNDPVSLQTGRIDPGPEAKVYTYRLKLHKSDGQTTESLAGAHFTLQALQDGQAGPYVQADGSLATSAYEFATDEAGELVASGIDAGDYLLRETQAPDGYATLASDLHLQVRSSLDGSSLTLSDLSATIDAGTAATVSSVDASTGTVTLDVTNDRRLALPLTGQAGMSCLSLIGALSALSASGLLWRHRTKVLR